MPTSTLTSKGQTTIPKKIREALGLKAGDKLEFYLDEEGHVVMRPAAVDVKELEGMLRREKDRVVSIEEMNKAIAESASAGAK